MKRNAILKSICTLLLFSTFFFFQACETDIQGVGIDTGSPDLLGQYNQAVRNSNTYDQGSHERLLNRGNENSLVSRSGKEEDKELLLKLFLREFDSEKEMLSFLDSKGYPAFEYSIHQGDGVVKNSAIVPVIKYGIISGYIHYLFYLNGIGVNTYAAVDYLSVEYLNRMASRGIHSELNPNDRDYLWSVMGSKLYLDSRLGKRISKNEMDFFFGSQEYLNNSGLSARNECPDGRLVEVCIVQVEWRDFVYTYNGETGNWRPVGEDCSMICLRVFYGEEGSGEGTGGYGADGPTVPWVFTGSTGGTTFGLGGDPGTQWDDPTGCDDFSAPDSGNPEGEFGNGGIGDGVPPETNPREEAQLTAEIDAIFESIPGLDASVQYCLRNSASMRSTAQEAASSFSGDVNCRGENALDRVAEIFRAACINGCEGVMNEALEELEEEEWIDLEWLEEGSRLRCIVEEYIGSNTDFFCSTTAPRFNGSSQFDLRFAQQNLFGAALGTTSDQTDTPDPYYLIRIDDEYAENGCEVQIVKTIVHESIHAELMAYSRNSNLNLLDFPSRLEHFEMTSNVQHNAMAATYRDRIVHALMQVFGSAYSTEQYEALAWSGLFETDSWAQLSQSRKDGIFKLNNEVNTNCKEILCEAQEE